MTGPSFPETETLSDIIAIWEQSIAIQPTHNLVVARSFARETLSLLKAFAALSAGHAQTPAVLAALQECIDVLALCEHPRNVDPDYGDEVAALGDRIGYGALMASASASWRQRLEDDGVPAGGEFVAGPCQVTVTRALRIARSALSNTSTVSPAQTPPVQPTEAMLNAARDWSVKKYGRGIGNDAAIGCWQAMLAALTDTSTGGHAQCQQQWQPIETAPRDGTPLLAANSRLPTLPPVMVRWLDEMSNPDTGWCDAATASGDALYYNANYFDLWMPAPSVSSTDRGGKNV